MKENLFIVLLFGICNYLANVRVDPQTAFDRFFNGFIAPAGGYGCLGFVIGMALASAKQKKR